MYFRATAKLARHMSSIAQYGWLRFHSLNAMTEKLHKTGFFKNDFNFR